MKAKEFKETINKMTLEELRKEEQDLRLELFKMRFKYAASPLDNPMKLKFIKRDIARVKTEIRARELKAQKDAK